MSSVRSSFSLGAAASQRRIRERKLALNSPQKLRDEKRALVLKYLGAERETLSLYGYTISVEDGTIVLSHEKDLKPVEALHIRFQVDTRCYTIATHGSTRSFEDIDHLMYALGEMTFGHANYFSNFV